MIQSLVVLFVAAPPLIRAMFRLREARAAAGRSPREGVERMTALATHRSVHRYRVNRRMRGRRPRSSLLGLVDILGFGLFAKHGDATLRVLASRSRR